MDGNWTGWLRYWRRVLPGASEEEIRRRVRESMGSAREGLAGLGERAGEAMRAPAQRLYGETFEDSLTQWQRWIKEAAAWAKQFQKKPPWQKITQSGAWQGLTRRRW